MDLVMMPTKILLMLGVIFGDLGAISLNHIIGEQIIIIEEIGK
jgi:hypothetical protein